MRTNDSKFNSRQRKAVLAIALACCVWCGGAPFASRVHAASVLIPLQTCGINPAAGRDVVLTPLQAQGANEIPVLDKIQTNTDQNGNVWLTLMPGVYQTDVRPAWGQVGVTEFYFYVDPSNAVQSAFTNLLTATNNTYPPNNYAYSAQASDARYAMLPVTSNDIASVNAGQIVPPLGSGTGILTNVVATNTAGVVLNLGAGAAFVSTNYDANGAAGAAASAITNASQFVNAVTNNPNQRDIEWDV